jgi:hypothetical protein
MLSGKPLANSPLEGIGRGEGEAAAESIMAPSPSPRPPARGREVFDAQYGYPLEHEGKFPPSYCTALMLRLPLPWRGRGEFGSDYQKSKPTIAAK